MEREDVEHSVNGTTEKYSNGSKKKKHKLTSILRPNILKINT